MKHEYSIETTKRNVAEQATLNVAGHETTVTVGVTNANNRKKRIVSVEITTKDNETQTMRFPLFEAEAVEGLMASLNWAADRIRPLMNGAPFDAEEPGYAETMQFGRPQ